MDRRAQILKHITREDKGIEIGPWHSPLAAKRDGYRCLVLDVFDYDRLVDITRHDPAFTRDQAERIEQVDIIGSSTVIESLIAARGELGTYDYIVSSHNFEHVPNPLKFLRGCGTVLRQGGVLSMAIPDKRTCFDYFRPLTSLAAWLEAFHCDRDRPTPVQFFEQASLHARFQQGDQQLSSFTLAADPARVRSIADLDQAYATWRSRTDATKPEYHDVHCSILTPSSFKLLAQDAHFLQLSPFAVEEVSSTEVHEFFVHLRNVGYRPPTPATAAEFYAARQRTLVDICGELAAGSNWTRTLPREQLTLGRRAQCKFLLGRMSSDAWKLRSLIVNWLLGRG